MSCGASASLYAQPPFLAPPLAFGSLDRGQVFYGANAGGGQVGYDTGAGLQNLVGAPFAQLGLNRAPYMVGQFSGDSVCHRGSKNNDGACVCPGSADTAPWQVTPPALSRALFEMGTQNYSGQPNVPDAAARHLTRIHGMYSSPPSTNQWSHY